MLHIKVLWLIGLIFELRIGLVFQYTQLWIRIWFTNNICILNIIFTTHEQKSFTLQKMLIICGWFLIVVKKHGFSAFFMIFTVINNHRFLPNLQNPILRWKLRILSSFCTLKVSLYWFGVKFLWLEDFFLSKDKKTYFHIESVVYSYKNILEELRNYSSLSMNDYTDILYCIESNGFAYL